MLQNEALELNGGKPEITGFSPERVLQEVGTSEFLESSLLV